MDSIALPPPIPDDDNDKPEAAIRDLLARQARELVELTAARIEGDPLRSLSIIESYAASMRTVLADLDESPAPRRQRRRSNYKNLTYGAQDAGVPDFDPGPPGVTGDFMGNLSTMIDKQTSSQMAGHASSEIRNFAVALEALPEDDPLRARVRQQLEDRVSALEPDDLSVLPPQAPMVVIETGVAVAPDLPGPPPAAPLHIAETPA